MIVDSLGSDSVFSLLKLTRQVKVVQPYAIVVIKHGLFPSVCIGDNHETVLECKLQGKLQYLHINISDKRLWNMLKYNYDKAVAGLNDYKLQPRADTMY